MRDPLGAGSGVRRHAAGQALSRRCPVTAAKLAAPGIVIGADLRDIGLEVLSRHLGSSASHFHRAAHGGDDRPVRPDRGPKSVSAERTFDRSLTAAADLLEALEPVIDAAWRRIERAVVAGCTLILKVKLADFSISSRAQTNTTAIATQGGIEEGGREIIRRMLHVAIGVPMLGLTLSGFDAPAASAADQPTLSLWSLRLGRLADLQIAGDDDTQMQIEHAEVWPPVRLLALFSGTAH